MTGTKGEKLSGFLGSWKWCFLIWVGVAQVCSSVHLGFVHSSVFMFSIFIFQLKIITKKIIPMYQ